MHAMMEPEQILEHARAAEAAGAHRFCMVTQGQGLSKRDFEKVLEGARLVAEHTNLKRCASIGHMSVERATALKDAGIQRVHHNVETARELLPRGLDAPSATRAGSARSTRSSEAGLETCVGGILNLGESREQRVEMAFQLAEVEPDLRADQPAEPAPGHQVRRPRLMDPWEAVKWVAIFRLIIPDALFRLCGGRNENLGELQPLAVKAGLNGVMMGNFLTTLGSEPEEDRAMFEELGLNVARQADNGANPRPDNRSGWLDGETPRTPVDELIDSPGRRRTSGTRRPSFATARRARCRPSRRRAERLPGGDPSGAGGSDARHRRSGWRSIRDRGLYRRMRCVSGPQGPARAARRQARAAALLEQLPRPGRSPARARGGRRGGDALRRRRRRVAPGLGQHDDPPPARGAARRVQGRRGLRCCSARATSPTPAWSSALARRGRRGLLGRAEPRQHHRRLPARRAPRPSSTTTATPTTSSGGCARREGRGALIVTDGVFSMDGDIAPLERIVELAPALRRARDGRRGARHRRDRAGRARRGRRGRARGRGGRDGRHARQGARLLRRLRLLRRAEVAKYLINTARTLIFSTALPPPAVAAAMAALELLREQPRRVEKLQRNAAVLREALAAQGLPVPRPRDADRAADRRRRRRGDAGVRARARAAACSPRRSARRPCPPAPRACGWR